MNTKLTIKNFRIFDEDGVSVELSPLTILTGRNSAGKSSIVKAILLLNSFLEQIKNDKVNERSIELSKYKIGFDKLFDFNLGNFKSILHRNSPSKTITLEYTIHSSLLFEDLKVSFSFKDENEDKDSKYMHNGVLSSFCVKTIDDKVIYHSNEKESVYNLNLVKDQFANFALGEYLCHFYLGDFDVEGKSQKEMRDIEKQVKKQIDQMDELERKDIFRYLRSPFSAKEPIVTNGDDYSAVISLLEGGQIFQIPVLDECLAKINISNVKAKVDNILNEDNKIDDAEKFIIKRYINDIVEKTDNIADYWKQQEANYLDSVVVKNDGWLHRKQVCLPNVWMLSLKQKLWEDYPGLWIAKEEKKAQQEKDIEVWKQSPIDSFSKEYEILMRLNAAYCRSCNEQVTQFLYSYYEGIEAPGGRFTHRAYKLLCQYASRLIESLLFPTWSENLFYVRSTRALPRRIYTPETDKEFFNSLSDYLNELYNYQETYKSVDKRDYLPNSFINYWIGEDGFNLGKSISVESLEGSAIIVKLIKNDGTEVRLTDEGYGLTQLVSILLNIETAILRAKGVRYNNYLHQSDLDGLNTSKFYYEQQTIAIEEPEIHLHPAFQSKLADMFVAAMQYNIHFIVETHSEYIIRKLQVLVAKNQITNKYISIYYVDTPTNIGIQVKPIGLRSNGLLNSAFGKGFFDEAEEQTLSLLEYGDEDKYE